MPVVKRFKRQYFSFRRCTATVSYTVLATLLGVLRAASQAHAGSFEEEVKKAQRDMQMQVIQNSISQLAPEHWGADRNWYSYTAGVCVKPNHDPAVLLISAFAAGNFGMINLDAKTDEEQVMQFRAQLIVCDSHLQPKYSEYFYTDANRCKVERGRAS